MLFEYLGNGSLTLSSGLDYYRVGEQRQLWDHDPVDGRLHWLWYRRRHDPEHWLGCARPRRLGERDGGDVVDLLTLSEMCKCSTNAIASFWGEDLVDASESSERTSRRSQHLVPPPHAWTKGLAAAKGWQRQIQPRAGKQQDGVQPGFGRARSSSGLCPGLPAR